MYQRVCSVRCLHLWSADAHGEAEECAWPRRLGLGEAGGEYCSNQSVVEKPPGSKQVGGQKIVRGRFGLKVVGGGLS